MGPVKRQRPDGRRAALQPGNRIDGPAWHPLPGETDRAKALKVMLMALLKGLSTPALGEWRPAKPNGLEERP